MRTATVKEIKEELRHFPQARLVDICLRLAKFKKDNKELLTYLLFESGHEEGYIQGIKRELDEAFAEINTKSYYYIKKSVRKILRQLKKYIRYSQHKETEVELLLYFCRKVQSMEPDFSRSRVLRNLYARQLDLVRRKLSRLHEDLQYDFELELQKLSG